MQMKKTLMEAMISSLQANEKADFLALQDEVQDRITYAAEAGESMVELWLGEDGVPQASAEMAVILASHIECELGLACQLICSYDEDDEMHLYLEVRWGVAMDGENTLAIGFEARRLLQQLLRDPLTAAMQTAVDEDDRFYGIMLDRLFFGGKIRKSLSQPAC